MPLVVFSKNVFESQTRKNLNHRTTVLMEEKLWLLRVLPPGFRAKVGIEEVPA